MNITYLLSDLIVAKLKSEGFSIVVMILLLIGVGAGVYLTQSGQSYKSKAEVAEQAFILTDSEDNPLMYRGNNIYRTDSLKVRIRLKDISLLNE